MGLILRIEGITQLLFEIHKTVHPTVFTELLIGLSPIAITPPEDNVQPRVLLPAGLYGEVRNATTEMIYGVGLELDTSDKETASRFYQSFKEEFVAKFPRIEWFISQATINAWLDKKRNEI